jgi:hypothetical protein
MASCGRKFHYFLKGRMKKMCTMKLTCLALSVVAFGSPANATVEVLFNQITGHPKALVPLGAGLPAGTEFKVQTATGFDRPFASPDGTKMFFTGLANLATTEDECYIVVDGKGASTIAREGTTFGSPTAEVLFTGQQRMGINNDGDLAFAVSLGGTAGADKSVIVWDGATFSLQAREGGAVPGIAGETWGDGLNSAHVRADGTGLFCAISTAGLLGTAVDDFCMVGDTILIQSGDAIEASVWDAMNVSDFWSSSDGAHWMLVGDDATATTQDRIMAVDGVVVAREGVPLIGSSYVYDVSASFGTSESLLCEDGSYLLRGHNADAEDWVLRNGVVVANTDDPITPGNLELYDDAIFADCFFFIAGNSVGDYVVGGVTNAVDLNANAVLVLNGETIVAREGDMIDLNGNGLADDDAFISVFNNDDGFLTNDGTLVFFADARDAALVSIGQMVLRIDINPAPLCAPDIAPKGGNGTVDVDDLLLVINSWGKCAGCPADITGNNIVDVDDLLEVINGWGVCD